MQNPVRTKERTDKMGHKTDTSTEPEDPPRRSCGEFDWQVHCFICGKESKNQETYRRCETLSIHSTILKMCDNRGDAEALSLKRRIMSCSDLVAAEGRYHKKCRDTFILDSKSAKSIIRLEKKEDLKVTSNLKILASYVNG